MARRNSHGNQQIALQNAAKTLKANIQFASVDDPVQSVLITSSVPDEGKTTVAVNLARSFAQAGKKVLLVETDMRRRTIANLLGVHPSTGIYAVLAGQSTLENAVVALSQANMFFLDSEPDIPNPPDILSSKRFSKLASTLEDQYDYIIYDTPPVGPCIDAAILSQVVDGVVFVVRRDFAKRDDIVAAFDQLKKADARVIGTVFNYTETMHDAYYYATSIDKKGEDPQSATLPFVDSQADESPRYAHSSGKRFSR